jgi:glucose/arabinose dehydrogenase
LLFYTGQQFPESYRGNLFLALNGSGADRSLPTGYSVLRMPFEGGRPIGEIYDFASGWLRPDTRRWGSPMDLLQAADGSLLVSDDGGKRIYRIYYAAPPSDS